MERSLIYKWCDREVLKYEEWACNADSNKNPIEDMYVSCSSKVVFLNFLFKNGLSGRITYTVISSSPLPSSSIRM